MSSECNSRLGGSSNNFLSNSISNCCSVLYFLAERQNDIGVSKPAETGTICPECVLEHSVNLSKQPSLLPKFSIAILHCVLLSKRFMWLRRKGKGEPALLIKVKYVGLELLAASLARLPQSGYHCQLVSVYHFQPYYYSLYIPGCVQCSIWHSL